MNHRCTLSMIVPVYNVSKYLCDCLDSMLDQNVPASAYEIVCIDDGSTDGSGQILDDYGQKHEHLHVYHKPNGGVSSARNLGLEKAVGDYVWFIDSDDFILPRCLGDLIAALQKNSPQVLRIGHEKVEESFEYKTQLHRDMSGFTYEVRQDFGEEAFRYTAWIMITQRKLLMENGIRFATDMKYGEDTRFECDIYVHLSEAWLWAAYPLYYYRQVPSSVLHNMTPYYYNRRILDEIKLVECFEHYLTIGLSEEKLLVLMRRKYNTEVFLLDKLPKSTLDVKQMLRCLKDMGIYPIKISRKLINSKETLRSKLWLILRSIKYMIPVFYSVYCLYVRRCGKNPQSR